MQTFKNILSDIERAKRTLLHEFGKNELDQEEATIITKNVSFQLTWEFLEKYGERLPFRVQFVPNQDYPVETDPTLVIGDLITYELPSMPHERAGESLFLQIYDAISDLGLRRTIESCGRPTCRIGNHTKEPDQSIRPVGLQIGGNVLGTSNQSSPFPAVVIEIAFSHESLVRLREELLLWISDDTSVRIAIGIKIGRRSHVGGTRRMTALVYRRGVALNPDQEVEFGTDVYADPENQPPPPLLLPLGDIYLGLEPLPDNVQALVNEQTQISVSLFQLQQDIQNRAESKYEAIGPIPLDWEVVLQNRNRWFVRKWVDVRERDKEKWLEAQIIAFNELNETVRVHFKGYTSRFDEYLPVNSPRIAPLHTFTPSLPQHGFPLPLDQDMLVDAQDCAGKWFEGQVLERDFQFGLVHIHYIGFPSAFDEWIYQESYRLAPLGTFSSAKPARNQQSVSRTGSENLCQLRASAEKEVQFRQLLREHRNWTIHSVEGDGNCLFRSISHQLYGSAEHFAVVREKCVEYMEAHDEFFRRFVVGEDENSFQQYLANMRRDGVWGDHVEIQALSELYGHPIEVYAYQLVPMSSYSPSDSRSPLRISYHFQSHYNSIIGDRHTFPLSGRLPGEVENEALSLRIGSGGEERDEKEYLTGQDEGIQMLLDALNSSRSEFEQVSLDQFEQQLSAVLEESVQSQMMDHALQLSAEEVGSIEEHHVDSALQESVQDLHPAVQMMVSMGYPTQMCQESLGVVESMVGSQPDEVMTQYLMNYMLEGDVFGSN